MDPRQVQVMGQLGGAIDPFGEAVVIAVDEQDDVAVVRRTAGQILFDGAAKGIGIRKSATAADQELPVRIPVRAGIGQIARRTVHGNRHVDARIPWLRQMIARQAALRGDPDSFDDARLVSIGRQHQRAARGAAGQDQDKTKKDMPQASPLRKRLRQPAPEIRAGPDPTGMDQP